MRVLQIVKTTDGAKWAVDQVRELVEKGIDVHVALPALQGRFIDSWRASGADLHEAALDFPVSSPWRLGSVLRKARDLVSYVGPDLIHSHFFGPTIVLRYALGSDHPVPRIFQVPGPLHLEHPLFRMWELSSASMADYWIASSRFIQRLYTEAGIENSRVFLSYYGNRQNTGLPPQKGSLRKRLGISRDHKVIGNVNYMYAPKYFLGQTKGLKCHEDVIDAIGLLLHERDDIVGLFIGGQWGDGNRYENRLKTRAVRAAGDRILMPGFLPAPEAADAWYDFDLAVHVPLSENCGGVVEPFAAGIPMIASTTGGLPEVVIDNITGKLVDPCDPNALASAINSVLNDLDQYRDMAKLGSSLVKSMFDVKRTAEEVRQIYEYLLGISEPHPVEFDARLFLEQLPG